MTAPVTLQVTHRWVADDEDLTTATLLGSGNGEDYDLQTGVDNRIRLRIRVEETAGGNFVLTPNLYFSYQGGGYEAMSTTSDHVRAIASKNTTWTITDDDAITANRLGAGNGAWEDGHFDADGVGDSNIGLNSEHTECEYCIYLDDGTVNDNDTIDLRVYDGADALGSYTDTPQITVDKGVADRSIDEDADLTIGESIAVEMSDMVVDEDADLTVDEAVTTRLLSFISETDGLTVGEAVTVTLPDALAIDVSDGLTVGEDVTPTEIDFVSETDNITLADTPRYYSDSIAVFDQVTDLILVNNVAETDDVTVGESITINAGTLAISTSDDVTIGEDVTPTESDNVSETDDIVIADTPRYYSDDVAVFDQVTDLILVSNIIEADGITIADVDAVDLQINIVEADGITVGDVAALALDDLVISESDNITVADTIVDISLPEAGVYEISEADNITIGESITVALDDLVISETDDLTVGDVDEVAVGAPADFEIVETDNVVIGEAVAIALDLDIFETDGITVADVPAVSRQEAAARIISETDGLTVGENVAAVLDDLVISESDGITVTDTPAVSVEALGDLDVTESDGLVVGETVSVTMSDLTIDVSDGLTMSDDFLATLLVAILKAWTLYDRGTAWTMEDRGLIGEVNLLTEVSTILLLEDGDNLEAEYSDCLAWELFSRSYAWTVEDR